MPGLFNWLHSDHDTTPVAVQQRLEQGENLYLLDVRELHEYREAHVPGSTLIPLGRLAAQIAELPHDRQIVVICRSGHRSSSATAMLRRAGLTQVQNMKGGLIAWAHSGGPMKQER